MEHNFKFGLNYDDVLIIPEVNQNEHYTSRKQINLISKKYPFEGYVPIIATNMATVGKFKVAEILSKFKILTALHKYYTVEDYEANYHDGLHIMVTAGMKSEDFNNLVDILDTFRQIKYINLDVANGYMTSFAKYVEKVKTKYPNHIIIAGNVVTPDGVAMLRKHGADVVKIGIGNGSVCLTRHTTGIGYPQLQAILECSDHGYIIADGGFKMSGDICKAFCAGADAVMVGSLFAKTKEVGSEYYGMSSEYAQKKFNSYGDYKASEGKVIQFSHDELFPLEHTAKMILGGLRSCLSYSNCMDLDSFIGKKNFIFANNIYNDIWEKNKY